MKNRYDDQSENGLLFALEVIFFLASFHCVLNHPGRDHMPHLTIFNDVAVFNLFNTIDCPLAANVIIDAWRFSEYAGEAKRDVNGVR